MTPLHRLAIMQPYLLPYIGYFQLMAAVDRFVLLDDVNYIQRGWINRNRILVGGQPHLFTLPLRGASQNRLICEIDRLDDRAWTERMFRTLRQAYGRAPHYGVVMPLLESVLAHPALRLDDYLRHGLQAVHRFLGLRSELVPSSRVYGNAELKGQERILDICRQESASDYVNAIGGVALYEPEAFAVQGVRLAFIKPRETSYSQGKGPHVPWLSIIDVLMFNSAAEVRALLGDVDLVCGDNGICA